MARLDKASPDTLSYGALFAGYGGLELGAQQALGGRTLWHAEIEDAPSRILAHHWPDVPNLGDVTTVDWTGVPHVDVITGGSPCFPAGTLIDTTDGYRSIETIRLGDLVRTHRERYMPVVQLMRREAADTVAVKIMGAPEFVTTVEHPFYVRTKGRGWNNTRRQYDRTWSAPGWVEAGFLTKDHFVGFQIDQRDESVAALGEPLAYLIGRWLGDGWIRNAKRSSAIVGRRGSRVDSRWWQTFICCSHDDADDLEDAIRAAGYSAYKSVERTVTKFGISSKSLVKMLSEFGSGASAKRIPGWCYRIPATEQAAIWRGWIDSDGSVEPSGQVKGTTVSEHLAHGMARLARNAYRRAISVHRAKMPPTCSIEGRTVNQRDQFQVCLPTANREAFIEGDWCWTPVRAVRTDVESSEVYNFGVAEDESYTAWGVTVHNCQDLSVAGRRAGMRPGTRSGLWSAMARAIDTVRPRLVIWENVRGALSAAADSGMEPCPGCVGDPDGGPVLRALGRVLGDLADLGFDAAWSSFPAAEVGAAHLRWRVFLLAWQRGDDLMDLQVRPPTCPPGLPSGRTLLPTPTSNLGDNGGPQHPDKRRAGGHSVSIADAVHGLALLPTPAAQRSGRNKSQSVGSSIRPSLDSIATILPTPRASDGVKGGPSQRGSAGDISMPAVQVERWGEYAAAVARHEMAIGRVAPSPTSPPQRAADQPQLSPEFVEWLMMLPAHHVTGVPHLSRSQRLRALGNGVVPAQAAEGIARCLAIVRAGAAGQSAAA